MGWANELCERMSVCVAVCVSKKRTRKYKIFLKKKRERERKKIRSLAMKNSDVQATKARLMSGESGRRRR